VYLNIHKSMLCYFLYMLTVTVARFSDDNAIYYILPVLRMMSYFYIMGPIGQNQKRSGFVDFAA